MFFLFGGGPSPLPRKVRLVTTLGKRSGLRLITSKLFPVDSRWIDDDHFKKTWILRCGFMQALRRLEFSLVV